MRAIVACHSTNHFRQFFNSDEPGRSNQWSDAQQQQRQQQGQHEQQPADTQATATESDAASDEGPDSEDYKAVLGQELSPYTIHRLAQATGTDMLPPSLVSTVEALGVEGAKWPRFVTEVSEDGQESRTIFAPGFLLQLVELLPAEFVLGSTLQRLTLLAAGAAYVFAAVWVAKALLQVNYNLGLVMVVEWARDVLTPIRLATVLALAWFGNLWLYWVWFLCARVDEVLARIAPPVRRFCWVMFTAWVLYVALSPIWHHPTPWLWFATDNSAFHGMGLMRVPS